DVSRHDLPAMLRESHPGLALAADKIVAPHLELQVDRREIASERQDLEADAALLDAGAGRAGHTVLMNGFEAVAVLVQRVTNGVRAVPEGRIEHRDVLRLDCRLVPLEQLSHLGDDLRDIRGEILHVMSSTALATATSVAYCPCAPIMDRPTGRPLTVPP